MTGGIFTMADYLDKLDFSSLPMLVLTALLGISVFVQISPIKVNPWSWVAKVVRNALYGDVSRRLEAIEKKLDEHVDTDDKREADNYRSQILHFNNELLRPIDHTKEEFIEVLTKIDAYEKYCDSHPNYPNNRAVLAIKNIEETYRDRMKKRDFLPESSPEDEE